MDALQELKDELYVTAAEQFVKEYEEALDYARRNLSIYIDPCATSALTSHPQPMSTDHTVNKKAVDQLDSQHDRQLAEVEHILKYMLDTYMMKPGVDEYAEEIYFIIERFLNQLQKATDCYTVKLGISPYQNTRPYGDSLIVMMQQFQHLHLRTADCSPADGNGIRRGETEIK